MSPKLRPLIPLSLPGELETLMDPTRRTEPSSDEPHPKTMELGNVHAPSITVLGEPSDTVGFTQEGLPTPDSKYNPTPPAIDTGAPSKESGEERQPGLPTEVPGQTTQQNTVLSEVLASSIQKIILNGISSTQLFTDVENAVSGGTLPKLHGAQPYIAIPRLTIDGKFNNSATCDGCRRDLFGTRYKCLDCTDFDYCSTCMHSALQTHPAHHFLSKAEKAVYLREQGSKSTTPAVNGGQITINADSANGPKGSETDNIVDSRRPSTEEDPSETKYLVQTHYAYRYHADDGTILGEFKSQAPRDFKTVKVHDLPVIERKTIIYTGVRHAMTQSEMDDFDIKKAVNVIILITIHSPMVLNALRDIVRYYPGNNLGDLSLNNMSAPFELPSHHRQQLLQYKNAHPPTHSTEYIATCNAHIDEVVRCLDQEHKHAIEEVEEQLRQKDPAVSWNRLWILYRPGLEVYARNGKHLDPYVIQEIDSRYDDSETGPEFRIYAWNIDFDGIELGRAKVIFSIKPYNGEQRVLSLPCFPSSLHMNTEGEIPLRTRLIERGKNFFKITKQPSYMEYTGYTEDLPRRKYESARTVCDASCEPWRELFNPDKTDFKPFRPQLGNFQREIVSQYPHCMCDSCKDIEKPVEWTRSFSHYDDIDRTKDELEDYQYFLCSRLIYGYILKERVWRLLDVEHLSEPVINKEAINLLVLENENTKNLIKAICSNYTQGGTKDRYSADFIQGKGEGNVFLLHGPPGVGKTLTAECVAEYTERPLLPLTGGDIGSTSREVERNLRQFLRRGQDWNAVVLLDEADVYLGSRDTLNLERNSVISVFLREVEYYRGILFLTTNRVGQFDEAITSRVHFSLHFEPFGTESRRRVWKNNFDKLEEDRSKDIEVHYVARQYVEHELTKLDWNGREIRNAFQTAVTLALYDGRHGKQPINHSKTAHQPNLEKKAILKMEHIQQVVEVSNKFKDYITRTHWGDDPSTTAKHQRLRDDHPERESARSSSAFRKKM